MVRWRLNKREQAHVYALLSPMDSPFHNLTILFASLQTRTLTRVLLRRTVVNCYSIHDF